MLRRDGRISWSGHGQALHASRTRRLDLERIVAEEEPLSRRIHVRVGGHDCQVAGRIGLGSRIDGVEPIRDGWPEIRRAGVGVAKEELLGCDAAARVDHDPDAGSAPGCNGRCHVDKERRLDTSVKVAGLPQIALQGLEVCNLDVPGDEIADVSLQSGRSGAVLLGEGIAEGHELGGVPLRGQQAGQDVEAVGKLYGQPICQWMGGGPGCVAT